MPYSISSPTAVSEEGPSSVPVPPPQMKECQAALGLCSETGQGLAGRGREENQVPHLVRLPGQAGSTAEPVGSLLEHPLLCITWATSQSTLKSQQDLLALPSGCYQILRRIENIDRAGPAGLEALPSTRRECSVEQGEEQNSRQRGQREPRGVGV